MPIVIEYIKSLSLVKNVFAGQKVNNINMGGQKCQN